MPLPVLGVSILLSREGVTFSPEVTKRKKWAARIREALSSGRLTSGEASKLAGGLQWATQESFRRLGRAMIRAIFRSHTARTCCGLPRVFQFSVPRHIRARSPAIGEELRLSLRWFLQVLELDIAEERRFVDEGLAPGHLFTDARSTPPRVAAVLFM